jgi:8-oxo-dGTP pyrophosphatase MutT (NUDIX family)
MLAIAELTVILFKLPDGRYVFQRRTGDAPYGPGLLSTFGGWLEKGETVKEGLLREIEEEVSLDTQKLKIRKVMDLVFPASEDFDRDRSFHIFEADIPSMDFEVYEGQGAEAYTPKVLLERQDVTGGARFIAEKVFAKED